MKKENELPPGIYNRLQDVAQMFRNINYSDIHKFGVVADKTAIKQVRKLISILEDEDGQDERIFHLIADFVLTVIGKKEPIELAYYSETIDNWGRTESSKQPSRIKKALNNMTDDMFFEGGSGSPGAYYPDELEGKIVKVGDSIVVVPFF